MIDDVSRLLSHQRRLTEVRSATQPLGSPEPLNRARLASRLGEVNQGFRQLSEGARLLNKGLIEGAAKLRAAVWLEQKTGLNLTGSVSRAAVPRPASSKDQAASGARTRATRGCGLNFSPGIRTQGRVHRPADDAGHAASGT